MTEQPNEPIAVDPNAGEEPGAEAPLAPPVSFLEHLANAQSMKVAIINASRALALSPEELAAVSASAHNAFEVHVAQAVQDTFYGFCPVLPPAPEAEGEAPAPEGAE